MAVVRYTSSSWALHRLFASMPRNETTTSYRNEGVRELRDLGALFFALRVLPRRAKKDAKRDVSLLM